MSDLKELLERVEAADGPDRELDWNIYILLLGSAGSGPYSTQPFYTASIDAILALVEKVLPGCAFRVQRNLDGSNWAELQRRGTGVEEFDVWSDSGNQATLPLAILASLLKAKIAEAVSTS